MAKSKLLLTGKAAKTKIEDLEKLRHIAKTKIEEQKRRYDDRELQYGYVSLLSAPGYVTYGSAEKQQTQEPLRDPAKLDLEKELKKEQEK